MNERRFVEFPKCYASQRMHAILWFNACVVCFHSLFSLRLIPRREKKKKKTCKQYIIHISYNWFTKNVGARKSDVEYTPLFSLPFSLFVCLSARLPVVVVFEFSIFLFYKLTMSNWQKANVFYHNWFRFKLQIQQNVFGKISSLTHTSFFSFCFFRQCHLFSQWEHSNFSNTFAIYNDHRNKLWMKWSKLSISFWTKFNNQYRIQNVMPIVLTSTSCVMYVKYILFYRIYCLHSIHIMQKKK